MMTTPPPVNPPSWKTRVTTTGGAADLAKQEKLDNELMRIGKREHMKQLDKKKGDLKKN